MSKTCSVVIPSRGRIKGLLKAIQSINNTVYDPDSIEILVGIDDDDHPSLDRLDKIRPISNVKIHIFPRNLLAMLSKLCGMARGDWILMFNDDATIECKGVRWDMQLEGFPTTGVVLQPEIYKLNASLYPMATRTGFPWFPNKCWETFGCAGDFIPYPPDYEVCNLAEKHGWTIDFLKGVTVFHDWKNERAG